MNYTKLKVAELRALATDLGHDTAGMKKQELVQVLEEANKNNSAEQNTSIGGVNMNTLTNVIIEAVAQTRTGIEVSHKDFTVAIHENQVVVSVANEISDEDFDNLDRNELAAAGITEVDGGVFTAILMEAKEDAAPDKEETKVEVVPGTVAKRAKFTLEDGSEGSRADLIREMFAKDMSRQDIMKELNVVYHTVYSATTNMYNAAHPEGGGTATRGKTAFKINKDLKYVDANGVVIEVAEDEEITLEEKVKANGVVVQRAELMRELFTAGVERNKLGEHFGVKYATVYAATKDTASPAGTTRGGKKMVTDPETGKEMARVDYIRLLFKQGLSRKEIAAKITILTGEFTDYSIVWAATKPKKEEEPKKDEAQTEEAPAEESEEAPAEESQE